MKLFPSIVAAALIMTSAITAQTNLTTAVDFTATDVAGDEHSLFSLLDAGNYVLLKFTAFGWSTCDAVVGDINDAYTQYGSNENGLIVLAAFSSGTDASVIDYDNQWGAIYPTISGNAGGSSINNTYKIGATPSIILIAPDRQIVEQDIWPISTLDPTLEKYDFGTTSTINNLIKNTNHNFSCNISGNRTLKLINSQTENYKIKLFSPSGKLIKNIFDNNLSSGIHEFTPITEKESKGFYIISISNENQKQNIKFRN